MTILNDESMILTRDIDTALNIHKLFSHTPVRSNIVKEKLESRIPALYLNVL